MTQLESEHELVRWFSVCETPFEMSVALKIFKSYFPKYRRETTEFGNGSSITWLIKEE